MALAFDAIDWHGPNSKMHHRQLQSKKVLAINIVAKDILPAIQDEAH